MKIVWSLGIIFAVLVAHAAADTPANCTYEDIRGTWTFYEGERSGENAIDCSTFQGPTVYTMKFELLFPNVAVDQFGNKGYWTIIYNQGFEVIINYRKYFAFSLYKQSGQNVTSYCDSIAPGWSHDILGKNWACYNAHKVKPTTSPKVHIQPRLLEERVYHQDKDLVHAINSAQSSWVADVYSEFDGISMSDYVRRIGGHRSQIHKSPSMRARKIRPYYRDLPEEFDWRNVSGVNYVSPIRNQGNCGSCYAFSSMAMLEARLRIATNNTFNDFFSPQDIVSCSEYSQGCDGGFPYLIAGKYAQDFGVVPEKCNPYTGKDDECNEKKCKRYYVANYEYIGGFYGGCNEELMKMELVRNGPVTVAFEVYDDFTHYKGGVYHHTGLQSRFSPFMITNHAVLAVGYGVDRQTGEKYWTVKNSWGEAWGENGYFRIRRGVNECNIESIAVIGKIIP